MFWVIWGAYMRTSRLRGESDTYHVVARGVGRQIIFEDTQDRRRYLDLLRKELGEGDRTLLAWCLMDNHVHLLVQSEIEGLSRFIQSLDSSYALYFNKRHDRVGHLFQGRFSSEPVDSDDYLLTVVRYIHQNPVRAGFAEGCADYEWSSYHSYASEANEDGLTNTGLVLSMCGSLDEFIRYHEFVDDAASCIDASRGCHLRYPDDKDAIVVAKTILGDVHLEEVASLPRPQRDDALRALRSARLSVRQIERLTGVSRGVISRV